MQIVRALVLLGFPLMMSFAADAAAVRVGNVYYEEILPSPNCASQGAGCRAWSSATPGDNFTHIKHIYCQIYANNSQLQTLALQVWTAPSGGTLLREVYLNFPTALQVASTYNYYSIDHDIHFLVGQNRYVAFNAQTSGIPSSMGVTCAFTGDMVPPQ
jgi:hypothetical protein